MSARRRDSRGTADDDRARRRDSRDNFDLRESPSSPSAARASETGPAPLPSDTAAGDENGSRYYTHDEVVARLRAMAERNRRDTTDVMRRERELERRRDAGYNCVRPRRDLAVYTEVDPETRRLSAPSSPAARRDSLRQDGDRAGRAGENNANGGLPGYNTVQRGYGVAPARAEIDAPPAYDGLAEARAAPRADAGRNVAQIAARRHVQQQQHMAPRAHEAGMAELLQGQVAQLTEQLRRMRVQRDHVIGERDDAMQRNVEYKQEVLRLREELALSRAEAESLRVMLPAASGEFRNSR